MAPLSSATPLIHQEVIDSEIVEENGTELRQRISPIQPGKEHPEVSEKLSPSPKDSSNHQVEIVWRNVAKFSFLHLIAFHGLVLLPGISWTTILFAVLQYVLACVVG